MFCTPIGFEIDYLDVPKLPKIVSDLKVSDFKSDLFGFFIFCKKLGNDGCRKMVDPIFLKEKS